MEEVVKLQIKDKILRRAEMLSKTRLNAKNLMRAKNEFAISPLNYYIGILEYKEGELEEIDREIRQVLVKAKIHAQDANKERLYLKREELGRGLISAEQKYECMLLTLNNYLEKNQTVNPKLNMIYQSEQKRFRRIVYIKEILKQKYNISEEVNIKIIREKQKEKLMETIKGKNCTQYYSIKKKIIMTLRTHRSGLGTGTSNQEWKET